LQLLTNSNDRRLPEASVHPGGDSFQPWEQQIEKSDTSAIAHEDLKASRKVGCRG
jgi:hypothetical protein